MIETGFISNKPQVVCFPICVYLTKWVGNSKKSNNPNTHFKCLASKINKDLRFLKGPHKTRLKVCEIKIMSKKLFSNLRNQTFAPDFNQTFSFCIFSVARIQT